ncbi:MAG: hypothetical protein NC344_07365 [Bacteroidales bacterium]|nr:hypothetical protein [Bacteroidales bacterium]MCM1147634.1 hypothetical protein [Bacteroidales bacterium]MCM1206425.1 hypothetical protein [Bacillota bacterium]MCM1509158.1 hypothetical protein [Clostridium sp.]
MKNILMFVVALVATVDVSAQLPGKLQFVADGTFYLSAMKERTLTVQNEDVFTVILGSDEVAGMILSEMNHSAMNVTVCSFAIATASWGIGAVSATYVRA